MANGLSWKDTPDEHGGTVRTITGVELNGDTVTASHLESGFTAHDADGNLVTGRMLPGGSGKQIKLKIGKQTPVELNIQEEKQVRLCLGNTVPVPVNNYTELINKPSVNGVTLDGNVTGEDIGLVNASEKGEPGGIAVLDAEGKIPAEQLPSGYGSGLPAGGSPGDLLTKRSVTDGDAEWVAPADSPEQDNTRPITAAAVYTVIGNIDALLATI